jgi:hypothetical protein
MDIKKVALDIGCTPIVGTVVGVVEGIYHLVKCNQITD